MEIFWNTIARYNAATWQAQIIITLAGIVLTVWLYRRPTVWVKRSMKAYMVFINGWIGIAYYLMHCEGRHYNYLLAIFWLLMAIIWLWDLITGYTPLDRNPRYKVLAGILYIMPFLYPLLSWLRGMSFPMLTTTVMPCSVAVFTIGLLLSFSRKINLLVILFLCHWALISFAKIYIYKIPEDLLLAASALPAIYLSFKDYFEQNLHQETKPSARFMKGFLIFLCTAVGILLAVTLFRTFILYR